jgi:hypothetical protein
MKRIIIVFALIAIIAASCKKNDDADFADAKLDLYKSNQAFINSDWIFESTGDSLKDQLVLNI